MKHLDCRIHRLWKFQGLLGNESTYNGEKVYIQKYQPCIMSVEVTKLFCKGLLLLGRMSKVGSTFFGDNQRFKAFPLKIKAICCIYSYTNKFLSFVDQNVFHK